MLREKQVLLIDDSDTIRTYLQNVLSQKGIINVEGAATGQEGLEMCARRTYDLILVDLFLPDIDGIEVLKSIRATNDTSTVIMITGHGGIKSAIVAVQLGADGYIEKQDITSTLKDHTEFLYAIDQAMEHRAGVAAQKQLEQIRADFYAMVTHDLRNPTSIILIATDMLTSGEADPLTPSQQQLVSLVNDAANRLAGLINNYLDFAKIDAGYLRLYLGEVDMCQVVESSARFAQLQAQAKQQTLTLDIPFDSLFAWADAERLKQVLDNLLSNAIKYTPEMGQITLKLRVEGEQCVLSVSDSGKGIRPEQLPALFTKYHRIPGEATRGISGTGLGLIIVKEIIEAHGGSVHVESEGVPGKGTTFTVRIPLQQESLEARPAAPVSEEADQWSEQVIKEDEAAEVVQDPELRKLFWEETQKHLWILQDALAGLSLTPDDWELLDKAVHASHTLRGNAGAMQVHSVHELAVELDDMLQQLAKKSQVLTEAHLSEMARLLDRIASLVAAEQTA
jgi:signal transduction histidine kinase/HPt (histidine-containing phosphotransfer) domain-containing protein